MRTRRGSRPRTRTSIPPHSFSEALRFGLRLLKLFEPYESGPRVHTREPFSHQDDVHAHVVTSDNKRDPALALTTLVLGLETHPPIERQRRKPFTRSSCEGRLDLNPQQSHMSELRHIDHVAANHRTHQDGLGTLERRRCQRRSGNCNEHGDGRKQ
jgi:hypothetical protein